MKFTDAQRAFWDAFNNDRWMLMDQSDKEKIMVKKWIDDENDNRHTIPYELLFAHPKQTRFWNGKKTKDVYFLICEKLLNLYAARCCSSSNEFNIVRNLHRLSRAANGKTKAPRKFPITVWSRRLLELRREAWRRASDLSRAWMQESRQGLARADACDRLHSRASAFRSWQIRWYFARKLTICLRDIWQRSLWREL